MIGLDTLFIGGQLIFYLIEMDLMLKVKVMQKCQKYCLLPNDGLSWACLAHVVASVHLIDKPARLRFYFYFSNSTKITTNTETAMLSAVRATLRRPHLLQLFRRESIRLMALLT